MDTLLLLVGVVIGAFIVCALIGAFAPAEFTGRSYLKTQLKKRDVTPSRIPDACIDELVRSAKKRAEFQKAFSREGFQTLFVDSLNGDIAAIIAWLSNPKDSLFDDIAGSKSTYREIFERYNIR